MHRLTPAPGIYRCGAKERDGARGSMQARYVTCLECISWSQGRKKLAKAVFSTVRT